MAVLLCIRDGNTWSLDNVQVSTTIIDVIEEALRGQA